MALSNEQLDERIILIESRLDDLESAIINVASEKQMRALLNIRQQEIIELKDRVKSLESQVALLQSPC